METVFTELEATLTAEGDRREEVRAAVKIAEVALRRAQNELQAQHSKVRDSRALAAACLAGLPGLLGPALAQLAATFPAARYHRYADLWRFLAQQAAALVCTAVWCAERRLATVAEVHAHCGIPAAAAAAAADGAEAAATGADPGAFHIETEDYLVGLCSVPGELVRLAVNGVTQGEFALPLEVRDFVADFYNGFRLLNLRNDTLRKRYDGVKYDLKKIEEVVYDISVRKLVPQ
jgi:hypothetical protein